MLCVFLCILMSLHVRRSHTKFNVCCSIMYLKYLCICVFMCVKLEIGFCIEFFGVVVLLLLLSLLLLFFSSSVPTVCVCVSVSGSFYLFVSFSRFNILDSLVSFSHTAPFAQKHRATQYRIHFISLSFNSIILV